MSGGGSPWLVLPRPAREGRRYAVFFAYAGGSAFSFRPWRRFLPANVGFAGVELPGRGTRTGESFVDSLDVAADEVAAALAGLEPESMVLIGYSMGALLAYETARRLASSSGALDGLVLAMSRAPSASLGRPNLAQVPEDDFRSTLVELAMVRPDLFEGSAATALVSSVLRADLELCEKYPWGRRATVDAPTLLVAANEDVVAPPAEVSRWAEVLTGSTCLQVVAGSHMAIDEHGDEVRDVILAAAARLLSERAA